MSSCKHPSCDRKSRGFGLKPCSGLCGRDGTGGGEGRGGAGVCYLRTVCAHVHKDNQRWEVEGRGVEALADRLCDWNFYARHRDFKSI